MSEPIAAEVRRQIEARANSRCEYCRSPVNYAVQSFECEHIQPLALGGQTTLDNLAFACGGCNRCKAMRVTGIDPDGGHVVPLYNPRQQRWQDHFAWNDDFTLVLGLTATGRATVQILRLNRPGVVNLRRLLVLIGEHPPKGAE